MTPILVDERAEMMRDRILVGMLAQPRKATVDIGKEAHPCPNCGKLVSIHPNWRKAKQRKHIPAQGINVQCRHCAEVEVNKKPPVTCYLPAECIVDGEAKKKSVTVEATVSTYVYGVVVFKAIKAWADPEKQTPWTVDNVELDVDPEEWKFSEYSECGYLDGVDLWPDSAYIPGDYSELAFVHDPAYDPLTDSAILIGNKNEEVGLCSVLGYDHETGHEIKNTVLDAECTEEAGYWYHIKTADGSETLSYQYASFSLPDQRAMHAYLLKQGDMLVGRYGEETEIVSIRRLLGLHKFYRLKVNHNHSFFQNGLLNHNADRYAVATGAYNDNNTWSASTGGAPGSSFPTNVDNAVFDVLSGSITVTVTGTCECLDFDMTGIGGVTPFTGTLAGSGTLNVYGSMVLSGSATITHANALNFRATSTGKTIKFNGKSYNSNFQFNGIGGGWTFQDAIATTAGFSLLSGAIDFNSKNLSCATLNLDANSTTRSATLGTASVTCTSWSAGALTGLTFSGASATISGLITSFIGGGLTYGTVTMSGNSTGLTSITGANTFATLNLTNASIATVQQYTTSANLTVTGTLTITGNNARDQRVQVISDTLGTARTITAAVLSLTNVTFRDITGAGAGTWSGTSIANALGNSGITFTATVTLYKIGGTLNWFSTGTWSLSSGGASSGTVPLCHDNVVLDVNSFSGNGQNLTVNWSNSGATAFICANIDWTGMNRTSISWTATGSGGTALIQGNVTFAAGCTTSTLAPVLSGRGSHTLTTNGGGWATDFQIVSIGGTYTLQDAFSSGLASGVFELRNGTFAANNFNVTCRAFNSSSSNVRTLNMGSGTWTITATAGNAWNCTTFTNMTLNASTSTINFNGGSGGAITALLGSLTYNNVKCSMNANYPFSLSGSCTISGTFSFGVGQSSNDFSISATGVTIANLDFTHFSDTFTGTWNAGSNAFTLTGDLTLPSGSWTNSNTAAITVTGNSTITSNGKSLLSAITVNGASITVTLADTFTTTSTLTLTQGTLALGSQNASATTLTMTGSSTRAITGTGTISISSTGTIISAASTGLTISSTVVIKATDSSATTKTITCGGATLGNLWCVSGTGKFAFTTSITLAGYLMVGSSCVTEYTAGITVTVASMHTSGSTMQCATSSTYNWVITGGPTYELQNMTISRCNCQTLSTFYAGATSTDGLNNTNVIFGDIALNVSLSVAAGCSVTGVNSIPAVVTVNVTPATSTSSRLDALNSCVFTVTPAIQNSVSMSMISAVSLAVTAAINLAQSLVGNSAVALQVTPSIGVVVTHNSVAQVVFNTAVALAASNQHLSGQTYIPSVYIMPVPLEFGQTNLLAIKGVDESFDIDFDFTSWLVAADDTLPLDLNASVVSIDGDDHTLNLDVKVHTAAGIVKQWISGGQINRDYIVRSLITSTHGRTFGESHRWIVQIR